MAAIELFDTGAINVTRGPIFESTPVTLPDGLDVGRVRGMMLGLAIGDSLGNTSEGMSPSARRAAHGEIRDYLPNWHSGAQGLEQQRRGLPSDDTQLAFWTLEHLIEYGELVPDRLAQLFASRRIFGIGRTVSGFLKNYQHDQPWDRCGVASAGNGSLMRIAPVLIPVWSKNSSVLRYQHLNIYYPCHHAFVPCLK
jgi:ADP-ribosyl-[dinitrogen reductase] hydrolase